MGAQKKGAHALHGGTAQNWARRRFGYFGGIWLYFGSDRE